MYKYFLNSAKSSVNVASHCRISGEIESGNVTVGRSKNQAAIILVSYSVSETYSNLFDAAIKMA